MGDLLNNETIVQRLYESLAELGLERNREKFTLPDAGHRGYSIDVGSSYGEVAVIIRENGVVKESIRITRNNQFEDSMDIIALDVARMKAKVSAPAESVCTCAKSFLKEEHRHQRGPGHYHGCPLYRPSQVHAEEIR